LSLIQIGAQEVAQTMHVGTALIVVTVVGLVILWLVIFVVGGLAVAANTRAVGWVHLGEPASIAAAYRAILPRTGRYLWLMTLTYFRAWFPFALVYGGYAALLFGYVRHHGLLTPHAATRATPADVQAVMIFGLASLAFVVLGLAGFVYGVLMSLRYSLAVPACTVENLKARDAIKRSIALSKDSRGRIFMLMLLVVCVQLLLVGVTQGFFVVIGLKHHGIIPVWMRVAQQFLAFLTNTFIQPIYATGFTLFYYDQRVRKEGYDIERMMQTAGMTQSQSEVAPPGIGESIPAVKSGSVHE